jgi:hypothetical protein
MSKEPEQRPSARAARDLLRNIDLSRSDRMSPIARAGGRAARMVSEPPPTAAEHARHSESAPVVVGVVGAVDEKLVLGLLVHGWRTQRVTTVADARNYDLLLLCEPRPESVRQWVGVGPSVVAAIDTVSFEGLTQYLQLGVDEVVTTPIEAAEVVLRLKRALRKRARVAGVLPAGAALAAQRER